MKTSNDLKYLVKEYNKKRHDIKNRLKEFRNKYDAKDEDVFYELCFCILTPQSKAIFCDKAIQELKKNRLLFKGNVQDIKAKLRGVRFPNNKANYLAAAVKFFNRNTEIPDFQAGDEYVRLKNKLDVDDIYSTRDWLVKNIKGLGYKETSHFLRNVGLGKDLAILDVHILKNLKKYKVIKEIPASMSRSAYLDIEKKMRGFSKKIKIPLEELDLLFWSNQTGFIFK